MQLVSLRLCNFRSFGAKFTEIQFDNMTFVLGPNGAGKTVVLQALARMFSLDPAQRRIKRSDFHVPHNEAPSDAPPERELWIEADFQFPELAAREADDSNLPAVPGNFAHMQLAAESGLAQVCFRLKATIDQDGEIEENLTYVLMKDDDGRPLEESRASKQDRNAIQVHYLPARRDPTDHVSYSANALLGRALRSADWTTERGEIGNLTGQISESLEQNAAINGIADALTNQWSGLHKGDYFANPSISFARSDIENLLRHLSIAFTPGHGENTVDFSQLSDGQQSLLYVSLVLAMQSVGGKVLSGEFGSAFDVHRLRPAVFTLIAIEEPENSLSPHYLGRIISALTAFAGRESAQALVATHSPSLLRRVPPESIRYLRLDESRTTVVKQIELPNDRDAQKFVREGVQAFPELYFSRLVVLGEGDSEELVLPRLMAARGILADDASISVVPLGGRHVNHFWRLLHGLGIPHITLLDLDLARNQGGWGRIKYAANQLLQYADIVKIDITQEEVDGIPKWNGDQNLLFNDGGWISRLEQHRVFFSGPLDLDFMMMEAYPKAYEVEDEDVKEPDAITLKAVLGKSHHAVEGRYSYEQRALFDSYHAKFKLVSKPTWHIRAMASMKDRQLLNKLPRVLNRMFDLIKSELNRLPE